MIPERTTRMPGACGLFRYNSFTKNDLRVPRHTQNPEKSPGNIRHPDRATLFPNSAGGATSLPYAHHV